MSDKPLSFFGQISYTKLKEALRTGHVKANRLQTKNGEEVFVDLNVWVHDEAGKYNNNASIQLSLKKESLDANVKNTFYIGNLKYKTPSATEVSQADLANLVKDDEDDDLPF